MGKASRSKKAAGGGDKRPNMQPEKPKRPIPVFGIIVALLILVPVVVLFATSGDNEEDKKISEKVANVPVYADVDVEGDKLSEFPQGPASNDRSAGDPIPTISGTSFDNEPMTISAEDGAQMIAIVAHWCPHCQSEVPKIVSYFEKNGVPEGVTVRAISTSVQESQGNFPPAEWLAREKWDYETLIDEDPLAVEAPDVNAAGALGVTSFPSILFVDKDGNVSARFSGDVTDSLLESNLAKISG